jgi:Tol biopolymer transport system component
VIGASGINERTIMSTNRRLLSFDWSPDGSRVVYASQKSPAGRAAFDVYIYEFDIALHPAYSPDGKSIAFYPRRGVFSYFGERQVGVAQLESGSVRYVSDRMDAGVFGGTTRFWWSPDGSKLVFRGGKGSSNVVV